MIFKSYSQKWILNSIHQNRHFISRLSIIPTKIKKFLFEKDQFDYNLRRFPPFKSLGQHEIRKVIHLNIDTVYENSLYWAPRFYQQTNLSYEFWVEMKKLQRIEYWTTKDCLAMAQLLLVESIRDTTFEIAYNYYVKPSYYSRFNGTIDILVFNSEPGKNSFPVIPILFPVEPKTVYGTTALGFNKNSIVGACLHFLLTAEELNKNIEYVRGFMTNGQIWSLFEVHKKYVKKTDFYLPRKYKDFKANYTLNENKEENAGMFEDPEYFNTVVGLIRFGLGIEENTVEITGTSEIKYDMDVLLDHPNKSIKLLKANEQIEEELIPDASLEDLSSRKYLEKENDNSVNILTSLEKEKEKNKS